MLAQKLTRVQQIFSPVICHRLSIPRSSRLYPHILSRSLAMAHQVASSSHPAQLPALDGSLVKGELKPKENKEKKPKVADGPAYPLEVRFIPNCTVNADIPDSCNLVQTSSIIVSKCLRNSSQSMTST